MAKKTHLGVLGLKCEKTLKMRVKRGYLLGFTPPAFYPSDLRRSYGLVLGNY
jgi:hypothetical protein